MIVKWAGSKKWLFNRYPELFNTKYNTYFEPFLGGGSIFFSTRPKKSQISDINGHLINCFLELKKDPEKLFKDVNKLIDDHTENIYYKRRDEFNKSHRTELFLYLNRTCYNGIYRENKSGKFNVPAGRRDSSWLPFSKEDFVYFSEILSKAVIKKQGFIAALDNVSKNDFIYVDPPYIKENSFREYGSDVFSPDDLKKLVARLNELSLDNKILFSNFNLPEVKILFKGAQWKYLPVEKTTSISGINSGRKKMKEILIYNY